MSNNPTEPTQESFGSDEPTYVQTSSPYESSGRPSYLQPTLNTTPPPPPPSDSPTPATPKDRKKNTRLYVLLAVILIGVVVIGGLTTWLLTRPNTTKSTPPVTTVTTKGEVHFVDSQDATPGATDALRITATGLANPPDGSQYDAWLIDTTNEQVLPLGSLSKSNSTTFALSYAPPAGQSPTNLIGAGNKIEVTQEQGQVTAPSAQAMLVGTFPPHAFIHIRHLLFQFPTTPGNIGLLPGLINETQKVNALSQLLQNDAANTTSVTCIAQAIINVIEGNNGPHFSPLAANCTRVGIGNALIGDGFGILGNNGYLTTASAHAVLAASQSDTTEVIRLHAKDVETSVVSIRQVITKINTDALQLMANPATTTPISEMATLSDHAYHGFDQNGNGIIEPVVGEAGALTAYAGGHDMATLTLLAPNS